MKKVLAFIMVGLVYVVIAMAASWANSSTALDKTLESIGIAPGSANTSSQHSGDFLKEDEGNIKILLRLEDRSKEYEKNKIENQNIQLVQFLPIPEPPKPTDPPGPTDPTDGITTG